MKKKQSCSNHLMHANLILLGLLMLVPGLLKLFVMGPNTLGQMLESNALLSWAPMFWAWVLIVAEIGSGLAILARWKLDKVAWIPVVILAVATLTVTIPWQALGQTNWANVIFHLIAIVGYMHLGCHSCDSKKKK